MSISAEYGDVLEAVSKKDPNSMALIDQGINNIRNIQNPFLSEEDRSKYNRWYDDLKKKLASDDGSAKKDLSETNANAVAENIVRRLLAGEQIIPGRNLNLQDISGIGNPLLTAVVENIGFNTESPTSKLNLETVSRTLFTALEKVINEEGNELWKSSFEQVKNIRSLNHEIAEKYNKNPGALDSWALVKYTDLISSWDFVNGKAEDIDRAVQEIGAQIISMANSERPQSVFFETDNKAAIGRAWETYEKNSILVETDAHGNEMLLPSPEGIHYGRNYGEDRRLIDTQLRLVIQKELGVATGRLTPVDEDEPLSEKGMNTRDKKAVWYYQIDGGNRFIRVNPSRDPGAWTVQTGTKGRGGEIDWGGKEKLENNRKAAAWLTPPPETGYSVTEMLEMLEKQSGPQMSEEEAAEMEKSRLYRLSAEEADRRAKEEKNRRGPLRRE
ncbi:MAG: hypothetical protein LBK27_05530 [Treponema sp.]|nr:hypothetical protein [Treponema sp.]